jgi:Resolvase, N terminal domain
LARSRYDDGGFSGGKLERPGMQRLLADIRAGRIDIVLVYKVDRLTPSLADFARLVEIFDAQGASFVSVTQQFNTTSSMATVADHALRPLSLGTDGLQTHRRRKQDSNPLGPRTTATMVFVRLFGSAPSG